MRKDWPVNQRSALSRQLEQLIKPKDCEELARRTIELKRMLTGLIQKLNADR